jgi:hypothetical protein
VVEVRRDREPHRGPFLQLLGTCSLALGAAGLLLLLPALAAMPLGVAVCVMARRDRGKMPIGLMDPAGKEAVAAARRWAIDGLVLGILSVCVWGLLLYQALDP